MELVAKKDAKDARSSAWKASISEIKKDLDEAVRLLALLNNSDVDRLIRKLKEEITPAKADVMRASRKALRYIKGVESEAKDNLIAWLTTKKEEHSREYSSKVFSESSVVKYHIAGVGLFDFLYQHLLNSKINYLNEETILLYF